MRSSRSDMREDKTRDPTLPDMISCSWLALHGSRGALRSLQNSGLWPAARNPIAFLPLRGSFEETLQPATRQSRTEGATARSHEIAITLDPETQKNFSAAAGFAMARIFSIAKHRSPPGNVVLVSNSLRTILKSKHSGD